MSDDKSLRLFLRENDPATDLTLARLARVETRLFERVAATPQGNYLRPQESLFPDIIVPLWRSGLLALLILIFGVCAGAALPLSSAEKTQTAESFSGPRVTVFAMAAPWQAIVDK